mmetsp:Transcript_15225/g.53019  ORF Transcript_15225/g.53019 Transcript_15225/m.53019 type:complete len:284 (+) Transcript_15225:1583-2434(+)
MRPLRQDADFQTEDGRLPGRHVLEARPHAGAGLALLRHRRRLRAARDVHGARLCLRASRLGCGLCRGELYFHDRRFIRGRSLLLSGPRIVRDRPRRGLYRAWRPVQIQANAPLYHPVAAHGRAHDCDSDGQSDAQADADSHPFTDAAAHAAADGQANGQADEQADEQANAQADGIADGQAHAEADARPDGQADGQADAPADVRADARADAQPDARAVAHADGHADAQPDAQPDGRADACADAEADARADAHSDASARSLRALHQGGDAGLDDGQVPWGDLLAA